MPPTSRSSRWTSWPAPCGPWPSPWPAAALVTTLAGAAVGRWASGRALRPLAGLTDAAVAIAGGQLDTRVEAGDDADLEELASAFNRMTANLQDRIEREARFTSDVSHELRSPLTTLTATVAVLESHRAELAPRAQQRPRPARRRPPALHPDGRRPAGDLPVRRRLGRALPRRGRPRASWSAGRWPPPPRSVATAHADRSAFPVEIGPGVEGLRLRVDKRRFERVMANLVENASLYAGGVTRVAVERQPRADRRRRPPADASGSSSRTTVRGSPTPSANTSSSASTGAAGPASGRRAKAPGSACPWWPSTSASTAARCGSRTPPAGAPGSSSSSPSPDR